MNHKVEITSLEAITILVAVSGFNFLNSHYKKIAKQVRNKMLKALDEDGKAEIKEGEGINDYINSRQGKDF